MNGKVIYDKLNLILDQQTNTLQTIYNTNKKYLEIPDEISLKSAIIVDYKIVKYLNHSYVLYKLEINNFNYDKIYCWKRYSDFELLYYTLIKDKGYTKNVLPKLPKKYLFGNMKTENINNRIYSLNNFLKNASNNTKIQWGIKVNDDINVYKRRVKKNNIKYI